MPPALLSGTSLPLLQDLIPVDTRLSLPPKDLYQIIIDSVRRSISLGILKPSFRADCKLKYEEASHYKSSMFKSCRSANCANEIVHLFDYLDLLFGSLLFSAVTALGTSDVNFFAG